MDTGMVVGLALMGTGLLFVLAAAIGNAEAFVYAMGIFFGEWGAMFVVNGLVPSGIPRVGVSIFFLIAMASTAFLAWKLRLAATGRRSPLQKT